MLTDRASTPPSSINGSPCSVAVLLDALPQQESDALSAMLVNPAWTNEGIWLACRDEGYHLGRQTVGRHRREQCRCWSASA